MASILEKLNLKTLLGDRPAPSDPSPREASAPEDRAENPKEEELQRLSGPELQAFVAAQPERAVVRLLQRLGALELQLRIVELVSEESALKRVVRSELPKKVKKVAERKLREAPAAQYEQRRRSWEKLCDELQRFLQEPSWEEARVLLERASVPELEPDPSAPGDEPTSPLFRNFQSLRQRLKGELEAFERFHAEMEAICVRLDPANRLSRSEVSALEARFRELGEKYRFPASFGLEETFASVREARARDAATRAEAERQRREEKAREREAERNAKPVTAEALKPPKEIDEAARREHLQALEKILDKLRQVEKDLAHPRNRDVLKTLEEQVQSASRFARENPEKFKEARELLASLVERRSDAVSQAQWDLWARTERAKRIQAELDTTLKAIESEADPAASVEKSRGLSDKLFLLAQEMRELGSLDRRQDQPIWKEFKLLTDRGWGLCDRTRAIVLEQLKVFIGEYASAALDLSAKTLSDPRHALPLKATAFSIEAEARIQELYARWSEIGARPSAANAEVETVGKKIFEAYFRQKNLRVGEQRRRDSKALERRLELAQELKIACEGKSTLLSRARVAQGIQERWKNAQPAPSAELQTAFDADQSRLNAELAREWEGGATKSVELLGRLNEAAAKIQGQTSLASILRSVSTLEAELQQLASRLQPFRGLRLPASAEDVVAAEAHFDEALTGLKARFKEFQGAAASETSSRSKLRAQALLEVEDLAIAGPRLTELRASWSSLGVLGLKDDSAFQLAFESAAKFQEKLAASVEASADSKSKALRDRLEVLFSLDALCRIREIAVPPLPLLDSERSQLQAQTLSFGMKYRQVLSLDPQAGLLKETKKLMERWSGVGCRDERLPELHRGYLERIHRLLAIQV
jgi:hypothetical protein